MYSIVLCTMHILHNIAATQTAQERQEQPQKVGCLCWFPHPHHVLQSPFLILLFDSSAEYVCLTSCMLEVRSGEEQPSYQHEAKASPHNWQRGKYMTLRGRDMVARYASLFRRSHYHAKMKLKEFWIATFRTICTCKHNEMISYQQLYDMLRPVLRKCLLVDACHAGIKMAQGIGESKSLPYNLLQPDANKLLAQPYKVLGLSLPPLLPRLVDCNS